MPKVSVIIPNFNHARFLEKRIRSVLDQTFQDFEVIFLDDASTDNSPEVFSQFKGDPRIRAIFNETNSGNVFKQWNKGFKEAAGEYVWIAESDDYADAIFLETLVARLDDNPVAGIAYCQSWVVDEHGDKKLIIEHNREHIDANRWKNNFTNNGRDECANYFIFGCMINNASSALVRRSVVEKIGYADEDWRIAGDWVFWVKMLLASDIEFVAQPLNYWRQHSGTVRNSATKCGTMVEESYKVASYVAQHVTVSANALRKARAVRFYSWVCYNEDHWFGLRQNRAIYRLARQFDPGVAGKILQYIPLMPLRMIARPVKRRLIPLLRRNRS